MALVPKLPRYALHVLDTSGNIVQVIHAIQSANYRLAENEVGDFKITVPFGDGTLPDLLRPPNRIEFWRDGVFSFGGIIRRRQINQEGREPFYTCSGPSYMVWLADNREHGATGTADVVYTTGHLDDVMKAVVRSQVLDTATEFVCAADSGLSTVSDTYTAVGEETCLETLQGIATRAKDTTFDIIRDTDGLLRFRTWTPSRGPDKSLGQPNAVLFDMIGGNLKSAEWVQDGNKIANALRGGGGSGNKAARYMYPVSGALTDSQSILDWGRIEGFIDAGNDATSAVDKKVVDELAKQSQPEESVSFSIAEFGRYSLGVDFDFGTRVTVMWGDILQFTDVIRGMNVTFESGNNVAQIDINVGDTLTGDAQTRSSIVLGRYLRKLRTDIGVVARR